MEAVTEAIGVAAAGTEADITEVDTITAHRITTATDSMMAALTIITALRMG